MYRLQNAPRACRLSTRRTGTGGRSTIAKHTCSSCNCSADLPTALYQSTTGRVRSASVSTTTASWLTCFSSCVHSPPTTSVWMNSSGQCSQRTLRTWQAGRAALA
jgi:hypothetical protein